MGWGSKGPCQEPVLPGKGGQGGHTFQSLLAAGQGQGGRIKMCTRLAGLGQVLRARALFPGPWVEWGQPARRSVKERDNPVLPPHSPKSRVTFLKILFPCPRKWPKLGAQTGIPRDSTFPTYRHTLPSPPTQSRGAVPQLCRALGLEAGRGRLTCAGRSRARSSSPSPSLTTIALPMSAPSVRGMPGALGEDRRAPGRCRSR